MSQRAVPKTSSKARKSPAGDKNLPKRISAPVRQAISPRSKGLNTTAKTRAHKHQEKIPTRTYLLNVAAQCLLESGVHGLRYSHISKVADVPQPLMGYHFPTLENLMMELVQSQIIKLREYSTQAAEQYPDEPRKALEAYIRAPIELAKSDAEFRAVWTAFYHLTTILPEFSDLNRQIRTYGRERIRGLLTMTLALERRLPEKLAEFDRMTAAIQAIITGMGMIPGTETDGDYDRYADLTVQTVFDLIMAN